MSNYIKHVHVDWYSFTCKLREVIATESEFLMEVADHSVRYAVGESLYNALFAGVEGWEFLPGRRPYSRSLRNASLGINVFVGGQPTILVEFTGTGCRTLASIDDGNAIRELMERTGKDATRLDVAVDIVGDVKPLEIVTTMGNSRIKARGYSSSASGETHYIGSRTSDKYCRVYRYNEPHPRSDRTRVEYELKRSQARFAAAFIVANGVEYVSDAMSETYKWAHECMSKDVDYAYQLPVERSVRTNAKTVNWLIKQAAPAFRRMVEEGEIQDPTEFLSRYFMTGVRQGRLL